MASGQESLEFWESETSEFAGSIRCQIGQTVSGFFGARLCLLNRQARCPSAKLARGFHQFVIDEHEAVHLRDRFSEETPDVEWMRQLASESGWVILSGDVAIGRNPHEVMAWKAAGHTIFFLKAGWTSIAFWQQVQKLARCFPDIINHARRAKPGEAFVVTVNGRIR